MTLQITDLVEIQMPDLEDGGAVDLADMYTDLPPADFKPEEDPVDPELIVDKDDDANG